MAQIVVCDDCMASNTLTLANTIQVDISVKLPDGTVRTVKGAVSACETHAAPVEAVAEWLGQTLHAPETPAQPPTSQPDKAPRSGERSGDYVFRCACGENVDISKRSGHAKSRHDKPVADIAWVPLFDLDASGLPVCECGYVSRLLTRHLNETGHKENVGKHPLKSDDFDTATGKALLDGVRRS